MKPGDFVTCRENGLGIGNLLEADRGIAIIEYFDSLAVSHRERVPVWSVEEASPPPETLCYWQADGRWLIGRVKERLDHGSFHVLADGQVVDIPAAMLRVRWTRPIPVGGFVRVADSGDGVGRLVLIDGQTARIEYFVSPVGPTLELRDVPAADVQPCELPAQTLIYWHDPRRQEWRLGRVAGGLVTAAALRAKEDHYDVRFPNDEDRHLPCSQIYVRWAHPIVDPTELLAARVTESPFFAVGRQRLLTFLAKQRAGFGGLTGLAGAAIEYHAHQLAAVRRVLADPVQRYLLADEVGLGKTIEAGMLIRQHMVDAPDTARVLILAPEHLCEQWREELATRFALGGHERVVLLSHDVLSAERIRQVATPTLVVIDEAHRVARWAWADGTSSRAQFELVDALAQAAPRLLLLTGTPLLHEEDGFLAMLHLLDPEGYSLVDRAAFRRRVEGRQAVADSIADLEDDAASLFAEDAIERLERAFPDDAQLLTLTRQLRSHVEEDPGAASRQQAIRALRSYIVESYRLHRRLLRTRREHRSVAPLLPQRTGIEWLECSDHARETAEAFLEEWRLSLPGAALAAERQDYEPLLFSGLVDAALSHPLVLLRRIEQRCRFLRGEKVSSPHAGEELPTFADEERLLESWSQVLRAELSTEPRVVALQTWLRRQRVTRAIVFVDDGDVADRVAALLGESSGAAFDVVRHVASEPALLQRFREGRGSILVCDRRSEEGLNLQEARAAVVFYDLPLEPARLEQRLGRVDRLEGMRNLRIVGFRAAGLYEQRWQECLSETIRIFNRSVAPLQYALAEATRRIRAALASSGPAAIEREAAAMASPSTGLEAELRRIRAQEALESLEWQTDEEQTFVDRIQRAGEAATEFGAESFGAWLERCVQYQRRGSDVLHYVHILGGRQPTLVPLGDTLERFGRFRDDAARGHRDELPLGPFTFTPDAVRDGVSLLRLGHPFVDALEAMVRADCRGTAWVFWRHAPELRLPQSRLYFCFHLVLETDLSHARRILDPARTDSEALRRQADAAFRTEYVSVWVGGNGEAVTNEATLACLRRPYAPSKQGSTDVHVRSDRWLEVEERHSTGDWQERCLAARRSAEAWVRARPDFRARCRRAAELIRSRCATREGILRSRQLRLEGATRHAEGEAMDQARALAEALALGAENPSARVDVAGAAFLAAAPLPPEAM